MSSRHYIQRTLSRRVLLRGAGVALTLPWLESLAPRVAGAQAAGTILRYIPIFLPNGASENWKPTGQGQGAAWQLSGVLSPLLANIALSVLDEHFTRQWDTTMGSAYQRSQRRRNGLGNWRLVRYADLCRIRHKSA